MRVDLSRLPLEVRRQIDSLLRERLNDKLLRAADAQRREAERNWRNPPHALDGIGPRVMTINSFLDSCFRQMYGENYSQDRDRMKWLVKKFPIFAVKSRGTVRGHARCGSNGSKWRYNSPDFQESQGRKFRKVYA